MKSIKEQKKFIVEHTPWEYPVLLDDYRKLLDWAERARKLIESNLDWLSDELYIGCELLKGLPE